MYTLYPGDLGDNMKTAAQKLSQDQFRLFTTDIVRGLYSFL